MSHHHAGGMDLCLSFSWADGADILVKMKTTVFSFVMRNTYQVCCLGI